MPEAPLDPAGDVSVVVVTFRSPDVLAECLESFEREQPRRVGEVIVVDNSTEVEGERPDARFPWIRYVLNPENVHFRRAVNQGARLAEKRYLFILNPDTYLTDRGSVARLAEVLDRDPGVGFVGPKLRGDDGLLAPQGERIAGVGWLLATKLYLNALWPGNPVARHQSREGVSRELSGPVETVTAGALLCRREQFLAVGGFDERARIYFEEHELARKLQRLGLHGHYEADAFVFHRWRQGGTQLEGSGAMERNFEEAMREYYGFAYGHAGTVAYDALTAVQRTVRAGVRMLRRR